VCERKFKGRQIEIRCFAGGRHKLYCPTLGCPSVPDQWCYPGASVVPKVAKLNRITHRQKRTSERMKSTRRSHLHRS
jgi:hypothetical protein